MFEWPTLPHGRLVVVGIANTMDLPERLLPRIASRVGMGRIIFEPYTREHIQTIVQTRCRETVYTYIYILILLMKHVCNSFDSWFLINNNRRYLIIMQLSFVHER